MNVPKNGRVRYVRYELSLESTLHTQNLLIYH